MRNRKKITKEEVKVAIQAALFVFFEHLLYSEKFYRSPNEKLDLIYVKTSLLFNHLKSTGIRIDKNLKEIKIKIKCDLNINEIQLESSFLDSLLTICVPINLLKKTNFNGFIDKLTGRLIFCLHIFKSHLDSAISEICSQGDVNLI